MKHTEETKAKIKATRAASRVRHGEMDVKCYELKFDVSRLSGEKLKKLQLVFPEAKWFYNDMLARGSPFDASPKRTVVTVLDKDKNPTERTLEVLSEKIRDKIIECAKNSIYGLSKKKQKGQKVGKLKFKKHVDSIPLNMNGSSESYELDGRWARIQKIGWMRVNGTDQIPKDSEVTSAKLIRRNSDYYLHVTTWQPKKEKKSNNKKMGVDAGVLNQLSLANGILIQEQTPITSKIRRLHKQLDKRKKVHGSRWRRSNLALNKEYGHISNQRRDTRNKIVSVLTEKYGRICLQDDNIKGWQKMWGRRVAWSAIGGIMSDLKSHTPVPPVGRFVSTTGRCSRCHEPLPSVKGLAGLSARVVECPNCGLIIHRDVNGARVIEYEALSAEHTAVYRKEALASTRSLLRKLNEIPRVRASIADELRSPRLNAVR